MGDTLTASGRKLTGYALRFNEPSVDLGGFREVIAPDALDRTRKDQPDLRALYGHDHKLLLGRSSSGTLKYHVDDRGLNVAIAAPDTQLGRDTVELVRRGDLSGMSFSFTCYVDDWALKNDQVTRTLRDMDVREVSAVAWPAYPSTSIDVAGGRAWASRAEQAVIERWNTPRPEYAAEYARRVVQVRDVATRPGEIGDLVNRREEVRTA